MYRNRKILEAAKDAPCMHCGADDGTTVAAHSNQIAHGKGKGIKAHDCYVAFLCHRCHDQVDGRTGKLSREDARDIWGRAFQKTLLWLCLGGVLK